MNTTYSTASTMMILRYTAINSFSHVDTQPTEEEIQARMVMYRKREKRQRYMAALQNMALQYQQILPVHQMDDDEDDEDENGNLRQYTPTGLWKKMLDEAKEGEEDEEDDDFDEEEEEEEVPSSEDNSFDELDDE